MMHVYISTSSILIFLKYNIIMHYKIFISILLTTYTFRYLDKLLSKYNFIFMILQILVFNFH